MKIQRINHQTFEYQTAKPNKDGEFASSVLINDKFEIHELQDGGLRITAQHGYLVIAPRAGNQIVIDAE